MTNLSSQDPSGHDRVIAIVGATGAVGIELLHCLEKRGFGQADVRMLASVRSAGQRIGFAGRNLVVTELT
ncbi:MAG: hypothetical protein RL367_1545, partial [Pseudomonadota bacterium]